MPEVKMYGIFAQAVIQCSFFGKRFAFRGFPKQPLGLQYSPLKDSGRANPAKSKAVCFLRP
ncbi:MAG: hypothetical protein A3E08_02225 [Candidatus Wildermuthbacteria bacterium RIFCSPHIGHO2_12_FULL_49_13]|nr:MAG: hypothetical protein A3E08_02225 [Candidatus Wildermuthbacteria bacterium RIFCSPHIGHO2_12_FULL_49_13]OHA77595.1 MAG: hypothetical protein A2564_02925 [Candidatus Wildermuthbacteria bacterium RIFOXYD1_FULL_50_12]